MLHFNIPCKITYIKKNRDRETETGKHRERERERTQTKQTEEKCGLTFT